MKQLFYNCTIVTGKDGEIFDDGYLMVENGIIKEVGSYNDQQYGSSGIKKVNLAGNWIIPGLINTHGHIGSTLLRGHGDDLPLDEWLKTKMWPMEAKFTEETVTAAAELALLEMLKSGTTTFLEMYHLHLDLIADLVQKSGVRAVITRGMIGLCSSIEQEKKLLEACELSDMLSKKADGRISTMLAPHAPYTCPPEFIENIVTEAKRRKLPIHIHLSETEREVIEHVEKYGKRPVVHMAELGVFDVHALIAHGVHLTNEEVKILADKNVAVSHNPTSNLKLGSGIADIPKLLNEGILVSLGTDSAASNNNLDMFQEMRMTALIHKGVQKNPTVICANEALKMATSNGAQALGLSNTGTISVGNDADFIIIEASSAHLQPRNHVLSHLVYSATGADVRDVYVKGNCLVSNKQCLTIDEEKVIFNANKAFNQLIV